MAVTSAGSGTQTAVLTTEHTLDTEVTPGVYVLVVDTANMVNGDIVSFKIYSKYATGGTSRVAYEASYAHVQAEPNKYSIPIPIDTEIICTLTQSDGAAGRDFPWNLLKL